MTTKEPKEGKDSKVRVTRVLKKGLFAKDLAPMMYGFGDSNPSSDTINVMEELLIEHITEICIQAQRISTNKGKLKIEDLKYALRHDAKKLARVDELLFMTEDIARARKGEDVTSYGVVEGEESGVMPGGGGAGMGMGTEKKKGKGRT